MEPPPKDPAPVVNSAAAEPQGAPKSTFDRTHVGQKGADLFSGMVAQELVRLIPSVAASIK
jgi:hypothetical protein